MIGILFWSCIALGLYTYVGYPVLLTLLAHLRSKTDFGAPVHTPTVTLIITAHNEQDALANKLENSLSLDYPGHLLQVLVIDDGSTDATAEIARHYAERDIELVSSSRRVGKLAAINRAMPHARGDIVLFSDANNIYDRNILREIMRPFADPAVGGVSGAKLIWQGEEALGRSEGLYWKYEDFIKRQEARLGSCTSASGDLFAIRRELYEAPPDWIINEDFYMALRLIRRGYRIVYVPQARSYDSISASAGEEIERRARIVAGRYQALAQAPALLSWRQPLIVWQVISHKFLRPLVPLAMAGAILTNVAAVLQPAAASPGWLFLAAPLNWILLALQSAFYASALVGNHVQAAGRVGKLFYLLTYLFNSNMAAVVGLVRFVMRRQSTRWKRVQRSEQRSI